MTDIRAEVVCTNGWATLRVYDNQASSDEGEIRLVDTRLHTTEAQLCALHQLYDIADKLRAALKLAQADAEEAIRQAREIDVAPKPAPPRPRKQTTQERQAAIREAMSGE